MRPQDTLIANELHPEELSLLEDAIGGDRRGKLMALDAWVALKALLPPKERRGVVLIDPPFEEKDEFDRIATGLMQGLQRFATGIYIVWYPIKDLKPVARFHAALAALAIPKSLRVELMLERPRDPDRLNGCGLIVVNPPYTLDGQLGAVLPELSRRLASTRGGGGYRLNWLDPTHASPGKAAPEAKRRMRIRP